jgi:hypothetical protein
MSADVRVWQDLHLSSSEIAYRNVLDYVLHRAPPRRWLIAIPMRPELVADAVRAGLGTEI